MPTEPCPDCGREVSTSAGTCPGCGRPIADKSPACERCGAHSVAKVRGLQGPAEVLIGIVLLLCFVIPGVVYYVYKESVPYCTSCGHRASKR